jgi:hypothetical protein
MMMIMISSICKAGVSLDWQNFNDLPPGQCHQNLHSWIPGLPNPLLTSKCKPSNPTQVHMNVCKHIVFGPPLCSSPVCPLAIYNPPFLFNLQLSPKVLITCRSLGHFLLFVAAVARKVLHHVEELHIAVTCVCYC